MNKKKFSRKKKKPTGKVNEEPVKTNGEFSIDLTPHPSIYNKMARSNQDFNQINGDFVDNSKDAMTDKQIRGEDVLKINITFTPKNGFHYKDNAWGMSQAELKNAIKLAYTDKNSGKTIGENGVGLKRAALSYADVFTVKTGKTGETQSYSFTYDDKKVRELGFKKGGKNGGKFGIKRINEHGTEIIIEKITKILITKERINQLCKDLSKRYGYYLRKGNVTITVNGTKIPPPKPPKWLPGYPINANIKCKYGIIRLVNVGLMETGNFIFSGFDLFKNERMIVKQSSFGINDNSRHHLNRIYGEIHLDFVGVTHEKNNFIVTSKEYEEAEKAFAKSIFLKNLRKEATQKRETKKLIQKESRIKENLKEPVSILSKRLADMLAERELRNDALVKSKGGDEPPEGGDILPGIKRTRKPEVEPRAPYIHHPEDEKKKEPEESKQRRIKLAYGRNILIEWDFDSIPDGGRKNFKYFDDKKKLLVIINREFPPYKKSTDYNSYVLETLVEATNEYLFLSDEHIDNRIIASFVEKKDEMLALIINDSISLGFDDDIPMDNNDNFDDEEMA